MTTETSRPSHVRPWQAWALVLFELIVAGQAVYGGVGLITDTWQLPDEWLARTPFSTWTGPGWALIGLIAVPHVLAAIPVVFLPRRPRLGIVAGLLAGASLLIWIGALVMAAGGALSLTDRRFRLAAPRRTAVPAALPQAAE